MLAVLSELGVPLNEAGAIGGKLFPVLGHFQKLSSLVLRIHRGRESPTIARMLPVLGRLLHRGGNSA